MSGLPSGVVTFLFSDIEGSTRLVKALRERHPQVLAEHRACSSSPHPGLTSRLGRLRATRGRDGA